MKNPNLLIMVLALSLFAGCGSSVDGISGFGGTAGSTSTALAITPTALPAGVVGTAYTQALTSTGTAPFTWSISSGTLPPGLTIDTGTGTLSGTPTIAGTYNFTVQSRDSDFAFGSQSLTMAVYDALTITTTSPLPAGTTGVAYSQTLAASGGLSPYTWSITVGALHADFALDGATGAITGTPTVTSASTFTIQVTDAAARTATQAFTLNVYDTLTITTTTPLPSGTIGGAYSWTLAAAGGSTPYSWALNTGSLPLPAGLSISNGIIVGNPTAKGTFFPTIKVTDSLLATATKLFTFPIHDPVTIDTASPLPTGMEGMSYSASFGASGGNGSYTYTVEAGSTLPAGLSLNSSSGVLSGIPAAAGSYNFTIRATDTDTNPITPRYGTKAFSLTVNTGISIAPATLPGEAAGTAYSQTLTPSNGNTPYTYSVTVGSLPPGLSLTPVPPTAAATGTISGTPTTAGVYPFTVRATDSLSYTGDQAYSITIDIGITTPSPLPDANGTAGTPYSQTLAQTGAAAAVTWSIVTPGGALPASLSLNAATGEISGTPAAAEIGAYNFTVQVTDGTNTGTKAFVLNVI